MPHLTGIVCPLLTPFNDDGSIARDLWVAHARKVLDDGAHYLSPFGTTGEALSVSLAERMAALEWLIEAGIPANRLMPGTGLPALAETAVLTAHAVQAGAAAAMVLPSFFYVQAGDDGQFRYFSELVDRVGDERLRIILYNIPQNSGVAVSPALTARLSAAFPQTVVAYKDSSGNWENTVAVMEAAPDVAMFPGSEAFLTQGLAAGAAGCISATVNIAAALGSWRAAAAWGGEAVRGADAAMREFRRAVREGGLTGGMKALLAATSGDRRWLNLRAPHLDATLAQGEALWRRLAQIATSEAQ